MIEFQYWRHKRSGEIYAVLLLDGEPTNFTGPLHYTEYESDAHSLADFAFDEYWDDGPDDYVLVECDETSG